MTTRKAHFHDGWQRACHLYSQLSDGEEIPAARPTTVRTAPGEQTLIDTELGYERSMGRNITAPLRAERQRSTVFGGGLLGWALKAIFNRRARARNEKWLQWADEQAAPQWRDFGVTRTVLTDQRLLCEHDGWTVFGFDGVVELRPDPQAWLLELRFHDTMPLRLRGAFAPWCSVALAKVLYGPNGLEMPAFDILRQPAEGRQLQPPALPR